MTVHREGGLGQQDINYGRLSLFHHPRSWLLAEEKRKYSLFEGDALFVLFLTTSHEALDLVRLTKLQDLLEDEVEGVGLGLGAAALCQELLHPDDQEGQVGRMLLKEICVQLGGLGLVLQLLQPADLQVAEGVFHLLFLFLLAFLLLQDNHRRAFGCAGSILREVVVDCRLVGGLQLGVLEHLQLSLQITASRQ